MTVDERRVQWERQDEREEGVMYRMIREDIVEQAE